MRYQFVQQNRSSFPVMKMCQVLKVSQSGYYRWRKNPLSVRKVRNEGLRKRIRELYAEHKGMAVSPMITADLRAEHKFSKVSKNRVARHMQEMGLKCRATRRFVVTTDSKHSEPVAPNILDRQFTAESPNDTRIGNIKYVKVGSK